MKFGVAKQFLLSGYITYEKEGRQTERFDTPDAENMIELNGIKSELIICTDRERS